jgi:tRNA_anti-like
MKFKKWHKILIVLILAGVIAGYFVWKWANKPNKDYKNVTAKETLTMQALMQQLESGDSATLKKYTTEGYLIAVKGTVKNFIASDSSSTINLGDSTSRGAIQCQMDARHNEDVKALAPGATITVKGVVAGIKKQESGDAISELLGDVSLGTDIIMNFCILETKK